MFGFKKKGGEPEDNSPRIETGEKAEPEFIKAGNSLHELQNSFNKLYAPHTVSGYSVPQREYSRIPADLDPDPSKPQLRILAHQVDLKRESDPYVGAKLAGREIYENLIRWLKNDKGVNAETLIAVIAACGGRECEKGVIGTLGQLDSDVALSELGVYIIEGKNGERYLMGDLIGNKFVTFFMTAANSSESPIERLKPMAAKAAAEAGTDDYRQTPYNGAIGADPLKLADMFEGKFEFSLRVFTRFPYERMLAFALAAQRAIDAAGGVIDKEKALDIIMHFGWKTSHYIGRIKPDNAQ